MLAVHIKEAARRKQELSTRFDSQDRALRQTAEDLSDAMLKAINEQVALAYHSEREIENQLRAIQRQITTYTNQTDQWINSVQRLNTELKEMGDIANWLQVLEEAATEIRDIANAMQK